MATTSGRRGQPPEAEHEKLLPPLLAEFRTALREEIEAAKRTASSAAVELISGRKVGVHAGAFQYQFLVESPLNLPDDSPADLIVPGQQGRIEATVVSVSGLTVVVSVPVDLGEFVGRARMQTDLTFLLRTLIGRLEEIGDTPNPAGDRLLGLVEPAGETAAFAHDILNPEQCEAVGSALGRDLTFVWGPPGTGKTMTLGTLATELHRRGRSVLLVSHTNAAVDQALLHVARATGDDEPAGARSAWRRPPCRLPAFSPRRTRIAKRFATVHAPVFQPAFQPLPLATGHHQSLPGSATCWLVISDRSVGRRLDPHALDQVGKAPTRRIRAALSRLTAWADRRCRRPEPRR